MSSGTRARPVRAVAVLLNNTSFDAVFRVDASMDVEGDGSLQVSRHQQVGTVVICLYHVLLRSYAQALREVDGMRVDGSFVDTEGNKVGPIACNARLGTTIDADIRHHRPKDNTSCFTS